MASFKLRQLYDAQGGICPRCTRKMIPLHIKKAGDHTAIATVDHVIPRARGGLDSICNMVAMCWRCNNAKGDKPPTGCDFIWLASTAARIGVEPFDGPMRAWEPPAPPKRTLRDMWPSDFPS